MSNKINKDFWIFKNKLTPFLLGVSNIIGYELLVEDIDAIKYGITKTNYEEHKWWSYELGIKDNISMLFALDKEESDILFIKMELPSEFEKLISVVLFYITEFELKHPHLE